MRLASLHLVVAASLLGAGPGLAQAPGGPPAAVGVVKAQPTAVTETSDFVGRVQAMDRVSLTARVTAFLDQRLFTGNGSFDLGIIQVDLRLPQLGLCHRQLRRQRPLIGLRIVER